MLIGILCISACDARAMLVIWDTWQEERTLGLDKPVDADATSETGYHNEVVITATEEVFLNGESVSLSDLQAEAIVLRKEDSDGSVLIWASTQAKMGTTIYARDALRAAGFENIDVRMGEPAHEPD